MFEKIIDVFFKNLVDVPTCDGCELHCALGTKWSWFKYYPTLNCSILGNTKYKTKAEAYKAAYAETQKCHKHSVHQKIK
ncbi:MAG: hypothetical protein IKB59_01465 [Alphaproteobacteria bacterium]|nr:hypothetical protein [Alphaproteobacteria bacterium]